MACSRAPSLRTGCWFRDKRSSLAIILMTGENLCTQRYTVRTDKQWFKVQVSYDAQQMSKMQDMRHVFSANFDQDNPLQLD